MRHFLLISSWVSLLSITVKTEKLVIWVLCIITDDTSHSSHWSNISLLWIEYNLSNISAVSLSVLSLSCSGFTSSSKTDPGTFSLAGYTNIGQVCICSVPVPAFLHFHSCSLFHYPLAASIVHPPFLPLSASFLFSRFSSLFHLRVHSYILKFFLFTSHFSALQL